MKVVGTFSKALCGVMIISGALFAAEGEHIPVGEREMSYTDRVALKETRAKLEKETENKGDELKSRSTNIKDSVKSPRTTYYTSHDGALHHPFSVSLLGDTVELEDGSIWAVSSDDRWQTLDWMTGDVIIILPNHNWFSIYEYRLINSNTGANVKVNLSLGPIYNGLYTHWILAMDYDGNEIVLEDGSLWEMSKWEVETVQKWLVNDTVIIGNNDGWLSGYNPNILINVNTNNHAMGECIY